MRTSMPSVRRRRDAMPAQRAGRRGAGACGGAGGPSMRRLAPATHSSQIITRGPATSLATSASVFLQNEQRNAWKFSMGCDDASVQKYLAKLSGPLLDRIDLHVTVSRVSFDALVGRAPAESSAAVRARVEAARRRQATRLRDTATMTHPLGTETLALLECAVSRAAGHG